MVSFEASADNYEIRGPLGSVCGGMGSVWLAKHKPTNSQLAIKIYDLDKCEEEFELIQVRIPVTCLQICNSCELLLLNYCTCKIESQLTCVLIE